MADAQQPYYTIRTRRPADGNSMSSADSTVRDLRSPLPAVAMRSQPRPQYGSVSGDYGATKPAGGLAPRTATHDISRVSYHVKSIGSFAQSLEDVGPNPRAHG